MTLYGSQTSPFVRRIRLLLAEKDYDFKIVDIYSPQERQKLLSKSPLLKIPILEDGSTVVWDSRFIFNYLCKKGFHRNISFEEENLLTAIQDISESFVQIMLAKRSHIEFHPGTVIYGSHYERIENTFSYLSKQLELDRFAKWDFLSMSLYALVDWVDFRQLTSFEKFSGLLDFRNRNKHQPHVEHTDPRDIKFMSAIQRPY